MGSLRWLSFYNNAKIRQDADENCIQSKAIHRGDDLNNAAWPVLSVLGNWDFPV